MSLIYCAIHNTIKRIWSSSFNRFVYPRFAIRIKEANSRRKASFIGPPGFNETLIDFVRTINCLFVDSYSLLLLIITFIFHWHMLIYHDVAKDNRVWLVISSYTGSPYKINILSRENTLCTRFMHITND